MRRSLLAASAAAVALLAAGCGAKPPQAVGVSAGPTAHYLRCGSGPRVKTKRLQRTPPFILRTPDGDPAMQVTRIPAAGILRGDGKLVTPAQFLAGRDAYCGARRQDRAAAIAIGFAAAVLLAVAAFRWLRARRSRNPYDRYYR